MLARPLDTEVFLNLFTFFCLILAIFVVVYFLTSLFKARAQRRIVGNAVARIHAADFLIGFVFGSISFLGFFLLDFFMGGIPTVLALDFLLIIGWLLSAPFFWGAALAALGAVLYQRSLHGEGLEWVMNIAFLGLVSAFYLAFSLLKKRWVWLNGGAFFLFIAAIVHGLLAAGLYGYAVDKGVSLAFYLIAAAVGFLYTAFGFGLGLLVNRGLSGTRRLSLLARNDYGFFVKQPFAKDELHGFIASRGLAYGFLLSFFSNPIGERNPLGQIYAAVQQEYADNDCLLLSLGSRYPTVFIPIKGEFGSIKEITNAAKSSASVAVVDLMRRRGVPTDFRAFFSIYGIHADSAKELLQINLSHLLSPEAFVGSRLTAHDPQLELFNEAEVAALDAFLRSTDDARIEHVFRRFLITGSREVYLVQLMSVPMLALTSEQCFAKIDPEHLLVATRYYAMQTLRDFFSNHRTGQVIVYYPLEIFMDRAFSPRVFLVKLAAQGFDVKRIVFCLNLEAQTKPTAEQLRRLRLKLAHRAWAPSFAVVAPNSRKVAAMVSYIVLTNGEIRQAHVKKGGAME